MATKTDQFDSHEKAELAVKSKRVKTFKDEGKSCRTCRHFQQRLLPRTNDPDEMTARCGLKNKPIRHYNICEMHVKLVVRLIPISEYLK